MHIVKNSAFIISVVAYRYDTTYASLLQGQTIVKHGT